jgi:tetratricopeptide (TPR) repeat protein
MKVQGSFSSGGAFRRLQNCPPRRRLTPLIVRRGDNDSSLPRAAAAASRRVPPMMTLLTDVRRVSIALACACAVVGAGTAVAQEQPPAAAAPAVDVDAVRARAIELCGKMEFTTAADVLKDALRRTGPNAALTTQEGVVYLTRARYERANGTDEMLVRALLADAMDRAKRALAVDAEHVDAVILLASAQDEDDDAAAARKTLDGWLAGHPRDAAVHRIVADRCYVARDWQGADLHYTKSLETDPSNGTARLYQTVARQWLGVSAPELEKGYLDAAHLLPDADDPLARLAGLYPKDRAKRLDLFARVVQDNPKAVRARVWIAWILRKEEPFDVPRALATLRDAAKLAPANADVHAQLGEALDESGAVADAVAEYTLAVAGAPAGTMTRQSVALDRLLHATKGAEGVTLPARERAYDALCEKNPGEGSYGNNAGLWFRDVGKDYEKSLKYYLLSVKAAPDDQDFLNDTALIYLFHLTDRRKLCLPMFEKVLRLVETDGQPPVRGYWDTLENLCKYWFEEGDYAKTIECATKRASPAAALDGRPYPSVQAARWKARAEEELAKQKK